MTTTFIPGTSASSPAIASALGGSGILTADLEILALQAYAQGRACLPALQDDVIPILDDRGVLGPRRLVQQIETRRILDQRFADELGWLLADIDRAVERGTTRALHSSAEFEGHVGEPQFWTETHHLPEAERLAQAGAQLARLRELVLAILDMLHAEQAVDRVRNNL